MATSNTHKMVLAAAAACEDKKAEDTRVLELDPADSGFTDYFLIASGTNDRQTVAIADEIELRLKREFGAYPNSVEGRRQGEWILLDYVDFVVHIFLAEKRAYYDIERLRKSAKPLELAALKAALKEKTAAARKKSVPKKASLKSTPPLKEAATKPTAKKATATKTTPKKAAAKKTAPKNAAAKKAAGSNKSLC